MPRLTDEEAGSIAPEIGAFCNASQAAAPSTNARGNLCIDLQYLHWLTKYTILLTLRPFMDKHKINFRIWAITFSYMAMNHVVIL